MVYSANQKGSSVTDEGPAELPLVLSYAPADNQFRFFFLHCAASPHTIPFALVGSGYLIRSYSLPYVPRSCVPASFIPRCTYLSHLLYGTGRGSGYTDPASSSAPTHPWASQRISLSVSKSDLHDLHFHPVVPDPCKKPEKAADRRIFQIVVPQHICLLYTSPSPRDS